MDERIKGIKVYVDCRMKNALNKLKELGADVVVGDIDIQILSYPFLLVHHCGNIEPICDMFRFEMHSYRNVSIKELLSYQSSHCVLVWRRMGDTHVADIPLPFSLRAQYVVKDGREITLQRWHGEMASVGVVNVGNTYTDVDSAKRAAEEEYMHKLTINGLNFRCYGKQNNG